MLSILEFLTQKNCVFEFEYEFESLTQYSTQILKKIESKCMVLMKNQLFGKYLHWILHTVVP